jgi:hypothetical protein
MLRDSRMHRLDASVKTSVEHEFFSVLFTRDSLAGFMKKAQSLFPADDAPTAYITAEYGNKSGSYAEVDAMLNAFEIPESVNRLEEIECVAHGEATSGAEFVRSIRLGGGLVPKLRVSSHDEVWAYGALGVLTKYLDHCQPPPFSISGFRGRLSTLFTKYTAPFWIGFSGGAAVFVGLYRGWEAAVGALFVSALLYNLSLFAGFILESPLRRMRRDVSLLLHDEPKAAAPTPKDRWTPVLVVLTFLLLVIGLAAWLHPLLPPK